MSLNTFLHRFFISLVFFISIFTIYFYIFIPDTTKLQVLLQEIKHNPKYTPPDEIPTHLKHAFVTAEDNFFYGHHGVDYMALLRAAKILILTGKKRQGGSTITMQLARSVYLHKRKTFFRKFNEILISYKIENTFSKDEILTLYLNKIYLGHNIYGIKPASKYYFSKKVGELSISDSAILASIPPAPGHITPILKPEIILKKRNGILFRLLSLKYILPNEYCVAYKTPLTLKRS